MGTFVTCTMKRTNVAGKCCGMTHAVSGCKVDVHGSVCLLFKCVHVCVSVHSYYKLLKLLFDCQQVQQNLSFASM